MNHKKILTILIKVFIGLGSFGIIFWRLKNDFNTENTILLYNALTDFKSYVFLISAILLFPLNWFIESFKWRLITAQTENISLKTASKSVYAAVCVGNLAPGRATEFLAKLHFFKPENKLTITVLHFVNGMFQLSITIFFGILSIMFKSISTSQQSSYLNTLSICLSIAVMVGFVFILFHINTLIKWIYNRFNKTGEGMIKPILWTKKLLIQLFGFSFLRYIVFASQFLLILYMFGFNANLIEITGSICIYFLFTTIIPMFSLVEAAVRTAIALVVFSGFEMANSSLAIAAILLWLINIVFPSMIGYIVIIREKLTLKSFSLKKQKGA